jgi:hypothetical protein
MGIREIYSVCDGKTEGKNDLKDLDVDGSIIFKEIGW